MSVGLQLFHALCDVATALDCLREAHDPATETWLALTCIARALDKAIDDLVRSQGLGGTDDAP